jgi:hypothetical protein
VVVLGGRILRAALDFQELVSLGASPRQALDALRKQVESYGLSVVEAFASASVLAGATAVRLLPLSQLRLGMLLEEEIRNENDTLIVARGHQITDGSLQRLRNYADLGLLPKTEFRVRMPSPARGVSGSAAA